MNSLQKRCAVACMEGSDIAQRHVAAIAVAIRTELRFLVALAASSRSRESPFATSGCQFSLGSSEEIRSLTQRSSCIALFLSIPFDILFSKRLLCPTEKGSHRSCVQFKRQSQFVVA